jgi:preprotein translocase subunit SecY
VFESVRNIIAIPDLRKRVLFTLGLLVVYRIGAVIPTPGIDPTALAEFFKQFEGTVVGFINMFSGGAMGRMTIFALGIMPYISASIILQLLTVVWPYLEKLSKEGELGKRKITQYTRYGTVAISLIQSFGIAIFIERQTSPGGLPLIPDPGWGFRLLTMLTLTTGTAFIMWLGEQITERGIGNGISLIIYAGIIVGIPNGVVMTFQDFRSGGTNIFKIALLIAFMVAVVGFIIFMERAQRRIPIQYAKRQVGRRVYGGANTYLPLKLNTGGVIPIIFAASVVQFPSTVAAMIKVPVMQTIAHQFSYGEPLYNLLYVGLIVFFCYFYTSIIFNPVDTADNMRKYGGFIPGIRPGKATAEFIDKTLSRITFIGAFYLAAIAILPELMMTGFKVQSIPGVGPWLDEVLPKWVTEGMGIKFYFGGTSLLIVVGVAMDTLQQIESQLIMRHYDGFLKRVRLRGRRG